jgi:hypothetical protein
MRPAHVYARASAEQHTALIHALHHEWRTATRMVMVVLSAASWSASEIADLLVYDPKPFVPGSPATTTKASRDFPTGPAAAGLGKAALACANGSAPCWPPRKPGPPAGSGGRWAGPG